MFNLARTFGRTRIAAAGSTVPARSAAEFPYCGGNHRRAYPQSLFARTREFAMITRMVRSLALILVAAGLVYVGDRKLTPDATKPAGTEKVENDDRPDGVMLGDAKITAAGIELATAAPAVLHDGLLLKRGPGQPGSGGPGHATLSGDRQGGAQANRRPRRERRGAGDRGEQSESYAL